MTLPKALVIAALFTSPAAFAHTLVCELTAKSQGEARITRKSSTMRVPTQAQAYKPFAMVIQKNGYSCRTVPELRYLGSDDPVVLGLSVAASKGSLMAISVDRKRQARALTGGLTIEAQADLVDSSGTAEDPALAVNCICRIQ